VRRRADGTDQYLPPRKARSKRDREHTGWTEHPDWWRPIAPESWQAPLPPPLPPLPEWRRHDGQERMSDIRPRRRRREADPADRIADKAPWWLDAAAIVYEPPGQVSLLMAEGRLMRALAVSGAEGIQDGPHAGRERVFRSIAEAMAEAEREAKALESRQAEERFQPGPADLEDWDTAMSWFAALDPPEERWGRPAWTLNETQQVLVWRARRHSWSAVSRHAELPIRTARDLYAEGIAQVCRVANGLDARLGGGRDHMGELRERNRAHRRRETADAGY
jgi:hypothetical protein